MRTRAPVAKSPPPESDRNPLYADAHPDRVAAEVARLAPLRPDELRSIAVILRDTRAA